jgi:hypothetical protein
MKADPLVAETERFDRQSQAFCQAGNLFLGWGGQESLSVVGPIYFSFGGELQDPGMNRKALD